MAASRPPKVGGGGSVSHRERLCRSNILEADDPLLQPASGITIFKRIKSDFIITGNGPTLRVHRTCTLVLAYRIVALAED